MMRIRPEQPADESAIFAVHAAAFPSDAEAKLVDHLRAAGRLTISLVAEDAGQIVGHIAFTPVTLPGTRDALGLAPVAVIPARQRQGIGSELIREGLAAAASLATEFVVVLGHPTYYPRFGFQRAADFGLQNEYGADEAFMVREFRSGALPPDGGLVQYAPEFGAFDR
jgi:putative acetyltransferase